MKNRRLHESRRPWSWLTFDVRQSMKKMSSSVMLLPATALVVQLLAYFYVRKWSHTDPSSSTATFVFEIGASWLFYGLPAIGGLGAILSLRHSREKPRLFVLGGVLLNLVFLVAGGLWASRGIYAP